MIDVGTDNEELRNSKVYYGIRQPRLKGQAYYDLMDEVMPYWWRDN